MIDSIRRSPHFPNELYREISRNLHQRRDKDTLLSLALVSRVWRHEGQRVLFSSLSNDWYSGLNTTTTHVLFLQSILAHPNRLGPYVHLYAQERHAVNPATISMSEEDEHRENIHLWELTSRALRVMINLKHLYMCAGVSANSMAEVMLVDCKFQLETLIWKCDEDSKEALVDFLKTQRVLTHLDVGDYTEKYDLSWLTADVCPNLTSTSCKTTCIGDLECRANVVALKADMPTDIDHLQQFQIAIPSVLERIKYLSVWNYRYPRTRPLLWPVSQSVALLELQTWELETLESLSSATFPNLQVLALLGGERIVEEVPLLVQLPILVFDRLPKLEHVFIRPYNLVQFGYHYKMSLDRRDPDEKVEADWVLRECKLGLHWWSAYEV